MEERLTVAEEDKLGVVEPVNDEVAVAVRLGEAVAVKDFDVVEEKLEEVDGEEVKERVGVVLGDDVEENAGTCKY